MKDSDKIDALERVVDDITNIGIYPASVSGPNGYEKRDDWKEGWNAAVCEMIRIYADSCRREFAVDDHNSDPK